MTLSCVRSPFLHCKVYGVYTVYTPGLDSSLTGGCLDSVVGGPSCRTDVSDLLPTTTEWFQEVDLQHQDESDLTLQIAEIR